MNVEQSAAPAPVVAEYKIGQNKGRPRIWIDGKRLLAAGFVGGVEYTCGIGRGVIACWLVVPPVIHERAEIVHWRQRKVTGRADGKPIIDLLGTDVEQAFPGGARVRVTFELGKLTIEAASEEVPGTMTIQWGMQPPLGTRVAWSARAIYELRSTGRYERMSRVIGGVTRSFYAPIYTADIDLVPDRIACVGHESGGLPALFLALDKHLLPALRKACVERFVTPDCSTVVEIEIDGYKLVASPRGSYGYLYIGAWHIEPTPIEDTPPRVGSDDALGG